MPAVRWGYNNIRKYGITHITHKNTMTGTPFTYGSCLDIVHKEALSLIATFLGVSINKSANEPSMVVGISTHTLS